MNGFHDSPARRWMRVAVALLLVGLLASMVGRAGAVTVSGNKKIVVLRVHFKDYANTSRYSQAQVQGFFGDINTLWGAHSSYNNMSIAAQVNDVLIQLPGNRSAYIDDHSDGDTSDGAKFQKVMDDAVANSTGFDWTDIAAVMVVMAETDTTQWHRGQGGTCNVAMGPGSSDTPSVGCAIFSENPSDGDAKVWGRWAHELGHAFQGRGTSHPSNYNSNFEQMDASYPGQTGVFEKQTSTDFGWMPDAKYLSITPASGGRQVALYAQEYDPSGRPNVQAIRAYLGGGGSAYYLVSVRRRVLGDDLNTSFSPTGIPDEGVLIERVTPGGSPEVTIQGNGGDRDKLWHRGDVFTNASDGITISPIEKFDDDDYNVIVRYADQANKADIGLNNWRSPPSNSYESTDIWVDSPVNGYGTFRYGSWSDLMGGTVPRGNGDDPAIGLVNRIYARVRNYGSATASNVVVHFDVTDPLGLGINGSNGFRELGTVDATTFPDLASIPAGGSVDVYIEWTPNATLTPQQIAQGTFFFHSCLRIRLDHLPNETIFGNQDGDGQQENVEYFQAPTSPGAPGAASTRTIVHLRNDSLTDKKYFNLNYDRGAVPAGWKVTVNGGNLGVALQPNEVREVAVDIVPTTALPAGSVAAVKLRASSFRLLVSDKDPTDKHPEFKELGGVLIEGHAVDRTRLKCVARRSGSAVVFTGQLRLPPGYQVDPKTMSVLATGAVRVRGPARYRFLGRPVARGQLLPDGRFRAIIERAAFREGACLFAGTDTLSSAMSGFIPVR